MKRALLLVAVLLPLARASGAEGGDLAREVVQPFLDGVKGRLPGDAALASRRQELRVLLADADRRAAERNPRPADRLEAAAAARKALIDGLVAERGGEAARSEVEALVEAARADGLQMRRDSLLRGIVCWCPKEGWTKTVAGCAEPCAEEQKHLVDEWLAAGLTNDEIIDRMVAHPKGDPRVRAAPAASGTNLVGYLAPFAILAAAALIAAAALRRVLRGRGKDHEGRAPEAEASAPGDDEIGERIERELREMET